MPKHVQHTEEHSNADIQVISSNNGASPAAIYLAADQPKIYVGMLDGSLQEIPTSISSGNLPSGGTTGQILAKLSDTDFHTGWVDDGGGSGSGLQDINYGDITVSGGGTVMTINAGAVSYAKIQNVSATDRLLGRSTAGAGNIEEIVCTPAGRALLDDADASAQRTTLGLGSAATHLHTEYALSGHGHVIADVTGLQTALDNKLDDSQASAFGLSLLDDADAPTARTTLGLGTVATHAHTEYAAASHTHAVSDITSFVEEVQDAVSQATALGTTITYDDANNKFDVIANTTVQKIEVYKDGASIGTNKRINFQDSGTTTITCTDQGTHIDVLVSSTGTGGGLPPDDTYGDIVVTGGGSIWTIGSGAVTFAKMQNVTGPVVVGRTAGTSGVLSAVTCTTFAFSLLDDADAATARTTLGAAATSHTHVTADYTDDSVTYAKIQNVSATDKLLGRASAGAGDIEEITCTATARSILDDTSTAAVLTTIGAAAATHTHVTADYTDNSVTYAKIQDVTATDKILGRASAGAGDIEEITCTAAARSVLDDTSTGAMLTTLGAAAASHTHVTADYTDDSVTYAKIQNVSATDKLLGRATAGAGDIEEITCTAAARSILDDTTTGAMLTTLGAAAASHTHSVSDITNFAEEVQDKIGDAVGAGTTISYNDAGNSFDVIDNTTVQKIEVYKDGSSVATNKRINFLDTGNATVTITDQTTHIDVSIGASGSGGLADGPYNDITVSGSGTVMTIANDAVTYAKMQNVSATDKILGRATAGSGDVEEITCTATARSLLDDTSTSAMLTTLGAAAASHTHSVSDITNFEEEVQDKIGNAVGNGTTITYDDANNKFNVIDNTSTQKIEIYKDGSSAAAANKRINFLDTGSATVTITDQTTHVDVSIGATGGSGATYKEAIGDGSTLDLLVDHNLGTRDVIVQLYRTASPYDTILVPVERTTTNRVTVKFETTAPTTDEYTILITAIP